MPQQPDRCILCQQPPQAFVVFRPDSHPNRIVIYGLCARHVLEFRNVTGKRQRRLLREIERRIAPGVVATITDRETGEWVAPLDEIVAWLESEGLT